MSQPFRTVVARFLFGAACALSLAAAAAAQSTDAGQPTPVFSGEIAGRIAPRDLGDARLTRHFYTFGATEGDLSVTVESTDLNGDVDVFTASTLRPLLKITLYAVGSTPTRVAKTVYLRREETLVLRVEGRTVIDTDAQYRIRLGGSFRPIAGAQPQATESQPVEVSETASTAMKGRRTTATGARIPRPVEEVVEQPAKPAETDAPTGLAETEVAREPARNRAGRRTPPRSSTRTPARRTRPPAGEIAPSDTPTGEVTEANRPPEERGAERPAAGETPAPRSSRARTPRRGTTRRGERAAEPMANPSAAETSATTPSETEFSTEPSTRLVIVTKDGELFARDMKTVRRVTVERGQIVVIGTDGRITRHPLSNVLRMSIEP